MLPRLTRFLRSLPLLLLCPFLLLIAAAAIAVADLAWLVAGRRQRPAARSRSACAASVVIPNWNGRHLLERFLPSVVTALQGNPGNEIVVVDNSSTDGSVNFLRTSFPEVTVLALKGNLGFGGGANAGFRLAKNDIVILLNSDMRVAPDFLRPLLEPFADPDVFAVGSQILFVDPAKRREETGLTQGTWRDGAIRVRHRIDDSLTVPFPCFYAGGGSSAFDRRRFLELGGFDPLFAPFYLEDTEIGFLAWKRGWKVLYQPRSVVWHEHRGTIGRTFSPEYIQSVYKKNFVLFAWKNIHAPRKLAGHFLFALANASLGAVFGDRSDRANAAGICRAFRQLPQALASRWRARSLSTVDDDEAFRRPLGGYFRDRFELAAGEPVPKKARVLFVSPYAVCPPVHGGGVFMNATLRELASATELHLIALLDFDRERSAHDELAALCASAELPLRDNSRPPAFGSAVPYAVREFAGDDLTWLIHRQIYLKKIDVVQLEYTALAQYACSFRRIGQFLFEHDIYFQSIARGLRERRFGRPKAAFEYLRALRFELRSLPKFDRVQVCSAENREYLASFLPSLAPQIQAGERAVIDTSRYVFRTDGREPGTMLFLGSFRHTPNQAALNWFVRDILPGVLEKNPAARLVIVGSDPPPLHAFPSSKAIELRGYVEDVREPLARYAVFVCPVLSGSGVRVKLLEAFASGIPVVSTRLGAEGLARTDGEFCALADDPGAFAEKITGLLGQPLHATLMAQRARKEVEGRWDAGPVTRKLLASYAEVLRKKRGGALRVSETASG